SAGAAVRPAVRIRRGARGHAGVPAEASTQLGPLMACELLVTGATGTLGRHVVDAALDAGHRVRALSRGNRTEPAGVSWHRGDLLANAGLSPAVAGVDAVIHCATQPTGDKDI